MYHGPIRNRNHHCSGGGGNKQLLNYFHVVKPQKVISTNFDCDNKPFLKIGKPASG